MNGLKDALGLDDSDSFSEWAGHTVRWLKGCGGSENVEEK